MRANRRRLAMTPVEASLVGGVVALLLLVMVPSLNHAKEQARIRVCLSNLRTIGQASSAYITEYADLPWALPAPYTAGGNTYDNWSFFTEFIWGGGMTDKTAADWNDSGLAALNGWDGTTIVAADFNVVPPKVRPLNRFFSSEVYWTNTRPGRTRRPKELPAVFKCPDDHTAVAPAVGAVQPSHDLNSAFRTWDWWGTSYAVNWYWPYYYTPSGANFLGILLTQGKSFLKSTQLRDRAAAETVVFMENQLNFALRGARPPGSSGGPWANPGANEVGWHGRLNYHAAAFLDGSARYQRFDTRYLIGKNWTIWPAKPWEGQWAQYNDIDP